MNDSRTVSRRDFIKSQAAIAAASVAGVTLPASLLAKSQDQAADPDIRWDKAPCRFCGTGCSVLVGTKGGKVIASQGDLDAPVNRGLNCIKGYFLPKILYGQDRLTQPLLRKWNGKKHPSSFEEFAKQVAPYTLEYVAELSGVPQENLLRLGEAYADPNKKVSSFWTMGFNQHTRGVWVNGNVYNVHLMMGKINEPGNSPFSLTGQPSACGTAREVGTFAHRLPADLVVKKPEHRAFSEQIWQLPEGTINGKVGYHAVLMHRMMKDGLMNCYWQMCNNNMQAAPNLNEESYPGWPRLRPLVRRQPAGQQAHAGCDRSALERDGLQKMCMLRWSGSRVAGMGVRCRAHPAQLPLQPKAQLVRSARRTARVGYAVRTQAGPATHRETQP